jgi:hypothetical protein
MRSSLTLEDRNNDPQAYDNEEWVYDPRPDFQHGVLPENPILVAFRDGVEFGYYQTVWLADHWRDLLIRGYDFFEKVGDYGQSDRCHATRVLTLLIKIRETND